MRRDNKATGIFGTPGIRRGLLALGLALLAAPAALAEDDVGLYVKSGAAGAAAPSAPAPAPAPAAPATKPVQPATAASAAAPAKPVDPVVAAVLTRLGAAPAADGSDRAGPSDDGGTGNTPSLSMNADDSDDDVDPGASADDFDAAGGSEKPMVSDHDALVAFYREPERKPVWVDDKGFNGKAKAVLAELAAAAAYGLRPEDFAVAKPRSGSAEALAAAELELSETALKYARYAKGGRIDPRKLSHFQGRGPRIPDYPKLLAELARSGKPGLVLRDENPHHPQFEALRQQLLAMGGKSGDIADPATQGEEKKRLLILLNMERWRWMPDKMEGDNNIYVWANIPELHVRVVRNGEVVFHEKAIVGLQDKQTPMFDDEMEWIEINPTWYVPDSIKVADVLPDVRRGGKMIARYGLRVDCGKNGNDYTKINWDAVNIRTCKVTQPIGPKSVLGQFKFKFPNRFSVYMHDTLNHRLFEQETRILSHGCVRVDKPRRMAEILLDNDKHMTPEQIGALVDSGSEHKEHLRRKIPVHTTYFTARVEDDGKLVTFPDYYFYDQRLAEAMYGRGALFPRQSYAGKQYAPVSRPRPEPVVNPLPQFLR
jgi:murein L,D-transpeptidase YcbB/YkuD